MLRFEHTQTNGKYEVKDALFSIQRKSIFLISTYYFRATFDHS